jgi:hypothetical protein
MEKDNSEQLRVDGRKILNLILETGCQGIDWTERAQDRNHVLLNTVMNFF